MMTIKELETTEADHKHAGNGWAMVEDCGGEMIHVVSFSKDAIGQQALLAWRKMLKPAMTPDIDGGPPQPRKLPNEILKLLTPLRERIKSGATKVVATRFVDTK